MSKKNREKLHRLAWRLIYWLIPPIERLAQQYNVLEAQRDVLKNQRDDLEAQRNSLLKEFPLCGNVELAVRPHTPDDSEQIIINDFAKLYYSYGELDRFTYLCSWLGYTTLKCPLDLWIYQELISIHKPDFIIETGTAFGGASLYLANICSLVGRGEVLTIDINIHEQNKRPEHPRITYFTGSSTDEFILSAIKDVIGEAKNIMVILDSDHTKEHVLNELRMYCQFIPIGGYLIVEDTNINGHPVQSNFGPGPMEALKEFLLENDSFEVDKTKERFLLTMNPCGYLRRIR